MQGEEKTEQDARTAKGILSPRKTRLDAEKLKKRREANRKAVQKHRENQQAQKKRRVRELRMSYYYKKRRKT